VGNSVGRTVVGKNVGTSVAGVMVGDTVVGDTVGGADVGDAVGALVGTFSGFSVVGSPVGMGVGNIVGLAAVLVGFTVGVVVVSNLVGYGVSIDGVAGLRVDPHRVSQPNKQSIYSLTSKAQLIGQQEAGTLQMKSSTTAVLEHQVWSCGQTLLTQTIQLSAC
jgi:hypothetical protein